MGTDILGWWCRNFHGTIDSSDPLRSIQQADERLWRMTPVYGVNGAGALLKVECRILCLYSALDEKPISKGRGKLSTVHAAPFDVFDGRLWGAHMKIETSRQS